MFNVTFGSYYSMRDFSEKMKKIYISQVNINTFHVQTVSY